MDENTQQVDEPLSNKTGGSKWQKCRRILLISLIALAVGYFHSKYVSELFENDRNFSMLSELEREMSLRSEAGFYYSYYKTMVSDQPYLVALNRLMYDNKVEYPKEVNAFNRFNIHPEVLLASLYRILKPWLVPPRECHTVYREPLPPVESCVGLGEPIMFYLQALWTLAGVTAAAVFVFGTALSNSIPGGCISLLLYAASHSHATRAMWSPNQRENFAQPALLLQACLVTSQIRSAGAEARRLPTVATQVSIFALNCTSLLFWQFSQFVLVTQIAILFVMEQLRIVSVKTLSVLLHAHFCGLHMAVLLLQGNEMLKTSIYTAHFAVVSIYCVFFSSFRVDVTNRLTLMLEGFFVILRIVSVVVCTVFVKNFVSGLLGVEADNHVWEILLSKFTEYKTFHSMLYTCSAVFDFMSVETWKELFISGLIPVTLACCIHSVLQWFKKASDAVVNERQSGRGRKKTVENGGVDDKEISDNDSGIENVEVKTGEEESDNKEVTKDVKSKKKTKDALLIFLSKLEIDPGVFYNTSQMVVFGVLAAIVMRLKLLFVPQMCLLSSLVMDFTSDSVRPPLRRLARRALLPALVACLALSARRAVLEQAGHVGEFSDPSLEELLNWVESSTPRSAVFACSLPLAATVLLTTRRAIVAHPHLEHSDARDRAYSVYMAYGRFPASALYERLRTLQATHLIVQESYCSGHSSQGCRFELLFPPAERDRPLLCARLAQGADHFYMLFRNAEYTVYKIHDYSVRYTPRELES